MNEEIFTQCYLDEDVNPVFVDVLRNAGFKVHSAAELKNIGLSDEAQLNIAISLQSTFITFDKRTFLEDSNAEEKDHFGIILIARRVSNLQIAAVADITIKKYLNYYTKEEFKKKVFYI